VENALSALEAGVAIGPFVRMEDRLRIQPPALLGYTHGHKLIPKWTGEGMNRGSAASRDRSFREKFFPIRGVLRRAPFARSVPTGGMGSAFPERGNHARYPSYLTNEDW
jgi:hypothetical protein